MKTEAAKEQEKLKAAGLAFGGGAGAKTVASPLDIWIEGKYAGFGSDRGASDLDGHFGLVTLGADYVFSRSLLVGVFIQYDTLHERDDGKVTEVESRGWMAGPYFTMRVTDHLFWQGRAAWGASEVDVSPFQTYTDSFDTERWMASTKLTGRWQFGAWTFSPAASLSYIEDTSDAYRDTFGALIPSVKSELGQAKIGPELGYRFTTASGILLEPRGKLELIWNFADEARAAGLDVVLGDAEGFGDVRGRAELGLRAATPDGINLDLSGAFDGIGSDDAHALSGKATLRVPLN